MASCDQVLLGGMIDGKSSAGRISPRDVKDSGQYVRRNHGCRSQGSSKTARSGTRRPCSPYNHPGNEKAHPNAAAGPSFTPSILESQVSEHVAAAA